MAGAVVADEVIGRDRELEAIDSFLAEGVARALVLEGEPGIGKTTLWLYAVEGACRRGYQVLRARPTETEATLSLAGLADVLSIFPQKARDGLPERQRRALAGVLAEEENGPVADSRVLGVAVRGLLEALASSSPVLVAIDDLQWLDEASGAILVYALRRLGNAQVFVLVSCRGEPGGPLPFALERAFDERLLVRVPLEPLSEGAIRRLLRVRLGLNLPRFQVHVVYEAVRGNPFFALELCRAGVEPDGSGMFRPPRRLQELVGGRLQVLPAATRDALLFVAALANAREPVLRRAGVWDELEPALSAGMLELRDERVVFVHPLLASAAWSAAGAGRRRQVHRALAGVVDDSEQRARHLAAAAVGPDLGVARLLEEAAMRARLHGAPAASADLLDRARELLPEGRLDLWSRLAASAVAAHAEAGHWDRVSELVADAQSVLAPGPERAAVLVGAAEMHPGLESLFRQAITEAGETPVGVRARIGLCEQATFAVRLDDAIDAAREAAVLARQLGERALLGVSLTFLGGDKLLAGRLEGMREIEEALAIEEELGGLPTSVYESPRMWRGAALLWADDPDSAGALLDELLMIARERGDEMSAFQFRQLLLHVKLHAGEWGEARALGLTALEQAENLGYEYGRPVLLGGLAWIEACSGDVERARALGTESVSTLTAFGDRLWSTYARAALALTELCAGDAAATLVHARAINDLFPGSECWWSFHQGDEVEALVLVGDWERALTRVEALRRAGTELELPRFLAWAERGAGLVHAARGDLSSAQASLERALAHHGRFTYPLERARTLLAYGTVLRRQTHRRMARAALAEALAMFEQLGASHFAEASRDELTHIGGRKPAGAHDLTGAEDRTAQLVAAGLSNKEVAAELYVAVSTVEATLTRVYGKLGVRSRSQLARALADRDAGG